MSDQINSNRVLISKVVWFQEGPGVRKWQYRDSGVKLLNVANLVNGKLDLSTSDRYISEEEAYGKYKHFLVDEGDLIIASSGIVVDTIDKKMGFANSRHLPLCMNTSTIRFKPLNPKEISMRFFMYFLKSYDFKSQLSKLITGIAQLNYGPSHLKKITMPVHNFADQQRIVAELDCLNEMIAVKQKQLKEFDKLAQSIFYDMFGDPVSNEKGWEIDSLNGVCDGIGDGLHGTPQYDDKGEIAFINGNNLIDGKIVITERTQFVNEGEAKKIYVELNSNTILLSINGTLGKTAIYNNERIVLGKSACYLRLKNCLNVQFVMALMNTNEFVDFLENNSSQSTIKNVGLKAIRNYKMILPPLALQQQFAEKISAIEAQKELVKQSIAETQHLLDYTMDKYFG